MRILLDVMNVVVVDISTPCPGHRAAMPVSGFEFESVPVDVDDLATLGAQ
jgi:hypothetical protein